MPVTTVLPDAHVPTVRRMPAARCHGWLQCSASNSKSQNVKELLLPDSCRQQACCMLNPLARPELQIVAGLLAALHKQSLLHHHARSRVKSSEMLGWNKVGWQCNDRQQKADFSLTGLFSAFS